MTAETPVCRRATAPEEIDRCLEIRDIVFIREQGVAPDLERDGLEGECLHFLAFVDGKPVATARVRLLDEVCKFQRVAVLKEVRGKRIGDALMRYMMTELGQDDAAGRDYFLSSQASAIPFYEKLGFGICSDEYMEAGIPHRDMRMAAGPATVNRASSGSRVA
ncbi:GNAT family N-acetyltransferase [Oricola sp.]|uniref:GNAT family N-acetyltransferase n=1 Tax=Oricola sp. TaxID=1979950 RepID=UPI003BAA2AEC